MTKHQITRKLVESLSGFGPTYSYLVSDPDAYRTHYGIHCYIDCTFARVRYLLRFQADHDIPGHVYLSDITRVATGEHWFAMDVNKPDFDYYPIDWAGR